MFIRTSRPLSLGARVKLKFEIPGARQEIETFGRVVRIVPENPGTGGPGGMGVAFESLSPADVRLINRLWTRSVAPKRKAKPVTAGKRKPARRRT